MVKSYVSLCTNCACTKVQCHKPYGKLKQLPILDKPWDSISMDFIENLPAVDGFCLPKMSCHRMVMVVVDDLEVEVLVVQNV